MLSRRHVVTALSLIFATSSTVSAEVGAPRAARPLALAPGGDVRADAADTREIRLRRFPGAQELRALAGHTDVVLALAYSADGKVLASGSQDQTLRLWDVATGREMRRLAGHTGPVSAVAFTPDGKLLASAGWDATVRLWDPASGTQLWSWAVQASPCYLVFSPNGRRLAVKGWDHRVIVWDVPARRELWQFDEAGSWEEGRIPLFKDTGVWVGQIAFAPDGDTLATGGWDGVVRLCDAGTGKLLRRWRGQDDGDARRDAAPRWGEEPAYGVRSLAYAPDGRTLVTNGLDGQVRLWEEATGREIRRWPWPQPAGAAVTFRPDGRDVVGLNQDGSVARWDTGRWERAGLANHQAERAAELWAELGADDAGPAHRALWALVGMPEVSVPFLGAALGPARAPDGARVRRWIAELDHERFAIRQAAADELGRVAELVRDDLRRALGQKPSLELRLRLEGLLGQADGWSADQLRERRAAQALEQIGTAAARAVLLRLARGEPAARLTREARASLLRLEQARPLRAQNP